MTYLYLEDPAEILENTTHNRKEEENDEDNFTKVQDIGIETNSVTQVPDSRLISTTTMNQDLQTDNGTKVTGVVVGGVIAFIVIIILILVVLYRTKQLPTFCYNWRDREKNDGKVDYSKV